jgi:hypothetical protein
MTRPRPLSPAERALRSRIAAAERWAHEPDRQEATRPARDAFLAKFEDQVDPDRKLPPAERQRRAEHARRAHMLRLAKRSAHARRRAS